MKVTIYKGDCLSRLRDIPSGSVQCVVTSPPYWGLRNYGGDPGMIGLEPTFEEHLTNIVKVFQEVRRVLRDDGTLWLNYGDAYSGTETRVAYGNQGDNSVIEKDRPIKNLGNLKPKNLMMMPSRVALALQADGWILRSEIVWAKPNPMPESVTDRPTSSHEKVYLFAKSQRYFYDAVAVRTKMKDSTLERYGDDPEEVWRRPSYTKMAQSGDRRKTDHSFSGKKEKRVPAGWASNETYKGQDARYKKRKDPTYKRITQKNFKNQTGGDKDSKTGNRSHRKVLENLAKKYEETGEVGGANLRNVWHIATRAYKQAHFATFPPALVEPCIKAGTSEKGCCADCGAPWVRHIKKTPSPHDADTASLYPEGSNGHRVSLARQAARKRGGEYKQAVETLGWKPSCECGAEREPCLVLDPFMGSGTVASVAARLGRDSAGVEINPEYIDLIKNRLTQEVGAMFLNFEER